MSDVTSSESLTKEFPDYCHEACETQSKTANVLLRKLWPHRTKMACLLLSVSFLGNIILTAFVIVLLPKGSEQPFSGPACPNKWIGHQGKCYYFSKEKRNWTSSQDFCLSHNASLMTFSASEEKDFVIRFKGKDIFWIGLRRDSSQTWKWTNGVDSSLEVIGNGGDCAFLNDENIATSSWCQMKLFWICSKTDILQCSGAEGCCCKAGTSELGFAF
uniref:C-type lectin domain-containing protein n=1 Tax=Varanus komodoensis TaxID=61221 RepID=A0A8D2IZB6_VARKO